MNLARRIGERVGQFNETHPNISALAAVGLAFTGLILIIVEHPILGIPMAAAGIFAMAVINDAAETNFPR